MRGLTPGQKCRVMRLSIMENEGKRERVLRGAPTLDAAIDNNRGWGKVCETILEELGVVMGEHYPWRSEALATTVKELMDPLQEARVAFAPKEWGPDGAGLKEAIRINHVWTVFAGSLVDAFENLFEESEEMKRS